MMVRRWMAGAAVVAMVAPLAACGGSDSDGGSDDSASSKSGIDVSAVTSKICAPKKKVGYVDIYAASPIEIQMADMTKAAIKALGWELDFVDAAGDVNKMQQAVQSFVTQKVDYIVVASADAAPIRQGLQAAKAAQIPVIEIGGGNLPDDLWTATFNEDEEKLGKVLGDYIVQQHPDGKVLNLATSLNYSGKARNDGLLEAIKAGDSAKIVATSQVDPVDTAGSAAKLTTDMLTAHPDADAVFAVFDSMAVSAASSIRTKGSDAKLYTNFATPGNLEMIEKGQLTAVVDVNLPLTAVVAIDQLANLANGGEIDKDALETAGGLDYEIVTEPKSVFDSSKTIEPFLAKWQEDFTC